MVTKAIGLLTFVGIAGLAAADVVVSYSYTDLAGSWDGETFRAISVDSAALSTGGDVSRLGDAKGTAQFDTGFVGLSAVANVSIEMTVDNITASSAEGSGSVILTDVDGDTITASFEGTWSILAPFGFMFFSGASSDYDFSDNNARDGEFNGTTGEFDLAGLTSPLFDGAISLLLQSPGGFATAFGPVSTQADGILIPTPGALVVAGLGLAGIVGRRRG